jgi:hypothetical protein
LADELQPDVIVRAKSPDDLASAAADEPPSRVLGADFPAAGDTADLAVAQLRDFGRSSPGDAVGQELHPGRQPPPDHVGASSGDADLVTSHEVGRAPGWRRRRRGLAPQKQKSHHFARRHPSDSGHRCAEDLTDSAKGGDSVVKANSKAEAIEWAKKFLNVAGDGVSTIFELYDEAAFTSK